MNPRSLVLLVAVGVSLTSAQVDFSERNNPKVSQTSANPNDKQDIDEPETTEKIFKNIQTRQRRPNYSFPSDPRTSTQTKHHRNRQSDFPDEAAVPHFGFSTNSRQSIYLSDHTGDYDLQLHNFHRRQPSNFQAALGAISAHILNQRNQGNHQQEYVPYPPNGNPYNHPSYRGNPTATEPPVVSAYERQSRIDPPVCLGDTRIHQHTPSRLPTLEAYHGGSPGHFHGSGFDNYPHFFTQEPPHLDLKSAEPLNEFRFYKNEGEII